MIHLLEHQMVGPISVLEKGGSAHVTCSLFVRRATDSVKHFQVTRSGGSYEFGFNQFATLQEFVNHFANQPLLGSDAGMETVSAPPPAGAAGAT